MIWASEEPKYRKKKPSTTSKASKKVRHRHNYRPCVVIYKMVFNKETEIKTKTSYCIECGKISGERTYIKDEDIDELRIPIFCLNNIGQDHIYNR